MGAIIGIGSVLLVVGLWTKKYLPGSPDRDGLKFFGYTFAACLVINTIVIESFL
ncbi:hypothetical protein KAR91_52330 [Candidatus Pacearchaeota archaeon]|nr:hypothetical protein [Candidatus Pacearchaeota archaeon]